MGLDALRGLAVVLMIQQHLGIWLWVGPTPGTTTFDYPVLLALNGLGGGAAPMFVVLAGVGCAMMLARRSGGVDRVLLLRGLTLIGFGYLLSAMTPSWFSWRSWYVLHLMGLGMCVVPLLRRMSNSALLALALALVALAPVFQALLGTPTYMHNARMAGWAGPVGTSELLSGGHLRLATVEGQFPIFPWMCLFVVGFVAGRWVVDKRFSALIRLGVVSAATGGLMVGMYFAGFDFATNLQRVFGFNIPFFPSTTSTILVVGGLVVAAIGAILEWEKRHPLGSGHLMVCLGRSSLTLLLVHVWLFREVRPFGLWKAFSPGDVAWMLTVVLVVVTLLSRQWKRIDYRYGAEWLLRVVGGLGASHKTGGGGA